MATELDRTASLQSLADSTGLIYDRAVYPEKVIGQAWLISRGRVVTLASAVSNYTDAPWALIIKFPHPNLTYAVRTVTPHPDFNRREARDYYLAQARGPVGPASFENDIATLALDQDLTNPDPERMAELNRALSVPFEISPQDMSGSMRGPEAMQILQSALSTGRSGLLTLVDQRNIPFARISIRGMRIIRAQFENLYNEIAMCELVQRKPPGNFALQSNDNYRWPADIPEIMTPPDQIMGEAMRREQELPRVVEMLGGAEVRFMKATKLADFNSIQPADRWVAERLWEVLDGYLPLHKVAEHAGTDTYSTVKMLWDFATMGLITVNQNPAFHNNGQLGALLVPAQEIEISTWDPLTAMYLDPVSGAPNTVSGNFFGSAHVLNNKSLLHTTPVPPGVPAAALFKEGKLVGIHCGPANLRGNNMPPMALQKMIWIGALGDLGSKRLRNAEAAAEAAELAADGMSIDDPQATSQRLSTLRNRGVTAETAKVVTAGMGGGASSAQYPEEETGPLAKYSKKQIAMGGGIAFAAGLLMMVGSMTMPHGNAPAPQAATQPPQEAPKPVAPVVKEDPEIGDLPSKELAEKIAGFGGNPPFSFKYMDTMKKTEPRESFGLVSELKNTDIIFINWPNIAPMTQQGLNTIARKLPVYNADRMDNRPEFQSQIDAPVQWVGGNYALPIPGGGYSKQNYIIGGIPNKVDSTKCVVWIAKGLQEGTAVPDLQYPGRVIEQMLTQGKAAASKPAGGAGADPAAAGGEFAKPEELAEYRKKLAATIKANYKMPKAEESEDTTVGMSFALNENGTATNITLKPNGNDDFNRAIQKAVDASQPFPSPPRTKNKLHLRVSIEGNNVTIEEE
jgi:outer membrane biosynthesis protein TonB